TGTARWVTRTTVTASGFGGGGVASGEEPGAATAAGTGTRNGVPERALITMGAPSPQLVMPTGYLPVLATARGRLPTRGGLIRARASQPLPRTCADRSAFLVV